MLANFELLTVDPMIDNIAILALQIHHNYCEPRVTYVKSIIYILLNDVYTFNNLVLIHRQLTYVLNYAANCLSHKQSNSFGCSPDIEVWKILILKIISLLANI